MRSCQACERSDVKGISVIMSKAWGTLDQVALFVEFVAIISLHFSVGSRCVVRDGPLREILAEHLEELRGILDSSVPGVRELSVRAHMPGKELPITVQEASDQVARSYPPRRPVPRPVHGNERGKVCQPQPLRHLQQWFGIGETKEVGERWRQCGSRSTSCHRPSAARSASYVGPTTGRLISVLRL